MNLEIYIQKSLIIKIRTKKRKHKIMKPNAWADLINDIFLKEHKLSSNFIYKKSYLNIDTNRSKYYLTFHAKCKDKDCGAVLFGWCD